MRSRGTKEIVATSDGRGFIALLENGELWRFNSMISSWTRELNPEEMTEARDEKKAAEAPKPAQGAAEAESWDTISFSRPDRLEALSQANRISGGVATTGDILGLARWVLARFGPP
jgi:hypothetical protein